MCNRVLLWFGKLPQGNLHVNGTIFESGLRFQGFSSEIAMETERLLKAVSDFKPV